MNAVTGTADDVDGFVVVGASLAGLRAVESARRAGYRGRITLIGAEEHLPYDRPPLSKAFLTGPDTPVYLATEAALRDDLGVDLRLGQRVTALHPDEGVVAAGGGLVPYQRLLIATGARARTLHPLPVLPGVVTLRSLDDARAIRAALGRARRVVVVGGGFIGAEIASSARTLGASVTIVEAAPTPLVRAVGEVVGAALCVMHERYGTELRCGVQVSELIGRDHVEGVLLANGQIVPADLVVVGVGALPATGWLAGSGVELDQRDGAVVCDEYLQTSVDGVYAAGDLVRWPNAVFGSSMRLENWTSAAEQGTRAAVNALVPARRAPYASVPYFWSDWYGQRIQFVGTAQADSVVFVSGDPAADRFVALLRRGDRLVGAATLNEPSKIMKYRRFIAQDDGWAAASAFSRDGGQPVRP
ncbi:NAD(P)/FAD-dependent oxidoreductase [Acrocarpospora catenulata]|uniref:NAD(P)/FAD-dependent oxidoreductase n=1 Tax=Acrocarpospora catenulata TaxID=2836182 RepID=UPI001BDAD4ED|nr:FAD-dependent oxidoreductase [Acrocarpospora catenulata]